MTVSVFIDGAVGTTGLEIRDRLVGRADLTLITLDEARRKDSAARRDALNDADIAILCLPDDAAVEAVALIDNPHTRVIDASSAHRVADGWTYGFPELGHDVAGALRVSNPGCYPTGFLALVAPLVRAGLIPAAWPLTVNAVSGYSGGGKALIERVERDATLGFRDYGFSLAHKHVPEMQRHAGLAHPPVFAPMVARAFRGMIVEVPLPLGAMPGKPSPQAILGAIEVAFAGCAVVSVHRDRPDELLIAVDAAPTDRLDLYVFTNEAGDQARLVATLDNLGKGASGAAVQNLNIMAGADPLTGLVL
ncbi:N-acetyl-gamma-glutamyl-phosphate reductase [Sphingomonas oligophenolica]|uniref:N-acetyl-gamma-glutamyl-phosphate reductase n=1 Tax=Sphingomonas oligophenolica TaxID=301154 RepID=A0A502CCX2_9SPHN|nr:N-acetyl-gamma-glutamyl-phosphate reductase [Sphingomonas oligophenolica]TPG09601.1 N-acetyl-gamma-glutamyl-phosphate reductase [Sphingomonas oligophenolica]